MLIDPARFGGQAHFQAEVAQLIDYVRSCPRVEGCDEITLPGDPERRLFARRAKEGLFLDPENWNALTRLAEKFQIPAPSVT
jgi:uncharacterized oxidoreductase